ncbi:hypothetical protein [Lysinibacillus telephonicus]|uniref:hypothetical protein n=1 Tax=Lysinibacillus telephonicus TaxID=1714840 RepID=UPI003BA13BA2
MEQQHLMDGDFLVFDDKPREAVVDAIYVNIDSAEMLKLKEDNLLLQQSLLEITTYVEKQDEILATQEQALLELTTLVAGGNA